MATSLLALAVGAINYFIAPRIDARLHGEKPMKSPKLTGSIIATVSTWLLLYSISIISTIYRDHRALVTSNQKLTAALVPQEQQIEQLRAQLGEACYRPDRHLTKEQEKLLFEALNGLAERTPANQRKIIMSTTWDDLESRRYMQELWNVLYRAGWNVPDKPYFR